MRLVIMRHGATAGNELRRYVGRHTDEPLSAAGERQCRRAGVVPGVRTVYASPLMRARQTAQLCFPQAHIVCVEGLAEFDFGDFEGRRADDMADDAAYRAWVESGCVAPCPHGESLEAFRQRTTSALLKVLQDEREGGACDVVVVAHGGTVMAAVDGFFHKAVGNCEGYVGTVRLDHGGFELTDQRRFRMLSEVWDLDCGNR